MNFEGQNKEINTNAIELALFNERIGQFSPEDLNPDADGTWTSFDQKVRDVFPEISEERFRAIKAAVTMHLCGL